MIKITKDMTLEDVMYSAGTSEEVIFDGDKMGLVAIDEEMMCPDCKEEDLYTKLEENGDIDEHGRSTWWLECPKCGYYQEQDQLSEIDDDSGDPDNRNYYI